MSAAAGHQRHSTTTSAVEAGLRQQHLQAAPQEHQATRRTEDAQQQLSGSDWRPGTSSGGGLSSGLRPLQLPKVHTHARGSLPGADTMNTQHDQAIKGHRASSTMPHHGSAAVQHQQQTRAGGAPQTVRQLVLVKDVLRSAQALTGSHCRFPGGPGSTNLAAADSGLQVDGSEVLTLPVGHRTNIHEMGELGVLYERVQAAIKDGQRRGCGSVRQALAGALHEELIDFGRLMAVLEVQLRVPQPTPGQYDTVDGCVACGPYLTLRRLQLWLEEPLRRMRLLAALVDACAGGVGGDLAGRVWASGKVGDALGRSYATRILHQVCVPLFDMIRRWVFEGVLADPACEFFVVPAASAPTSGTDSTPDGRDAQQQRLGAGRDLWRHAYRLEPAKLPPFVSRELAATILRAGKSLNFLRDACGDAAWVAGWAPAAAGAAAALGYGQLPVLERVVLSASASVDARLMAVLRSTGEWDRHCQAIRRYLLLGQGDFAGELLDAMDAELTKSTSDSHFSPASVASSLNHKLRTVLLSCAGTGRLEEEAGGPQERLRVELAAHAGAGEKVWDLFALTYRLGPPLSSVFTPTAQQQYNRLGRLLWRLRRTERSLNSAWLILKVKVERPARRLRADPCAQHLSDLLRDCLMLHAGMAHITTSLQYYINLEVVDCAWSDFMTSVAAAPDLDCLIAAHNEFLSSVLDRALLGGGASAEQLRDTLQDLLDNCMGLQPLVDGLQQRVKAAIDAADRQEALRRVNTAAGQWGSEGGEAAQGLRFQELADISSSLASSKHQHDKLVRAFWANLPAAAAEVNAEVRYLQARCGVNNMEQ